MSQLSHSSAGTVFRLVILFVLTLGLFSIQALYGSGSSLAADFPTVTPTRINIGGQGGFCGVSKSRLIITLQNIVINATRSVTGVKCGRLVFIKNVEPTKKSRVTPEKWNGKPKKDTGKAAEEVLALLPCSGGGPLIFQIRPRELLDYYQFVNLKLGSGKTVYTEEYGSLSQYITTFETYYPLSSCNECSTLAQSYHPYSTSAFSFPGTPQPGSQSQSIPTFNQRTAISGLVFPTSTPTVTPTATPTDTPVTGSAFSGPILSLAQLNTLPPATPLP